MEDSVVKIKEMLKLDTFDLKFNSFFSACQKMVSEHHLFNHRILKFENGRRYIKISSCNGKDSYVWAFVDKTNGDILKAASRNAPAKHARGNIFDADGGMTNMGVTGPAYLK